MKKFYNMKKIITIIAIFILQQISYAQGNLQFDHALTEQMEISSNNDVTLSIVVPSGQVLKITALNIGDENNISQNSNATLYYKKSTNSHYVFLCSGSYGASGNVPNLPIWLKEGTYDFKLICTNATGWIACMLSGIFFNVIP